MARKVRRVRRRASQADSGKSNIKQSSGNKEEELREEYAYVVHDLRQILILAVAMFLLLIVANLIL